jgi:VWFA-related protein
MAMAIAAAAAGAGGAWPARPMHAAQDGQATFRATADFVSVDVSVRRGGRPVTGLLARDFEIRDNGVLQAVADLSFEKLPIDLTVALDVSDSVTGAVLEQLRRSVQQLKADLGTRDRLRLLAFNMRVTRVMDFAEPASATSAAFSQIAAFGSTAIFDTVAVALTAASSPDRRQLIVIFSDGEDSSSITEPGVLIDVAAHTTPTVDFVLASAFSPSMASRMTVPLASAVNRPLINHLATETGGLVVSIVPGDNITNTFRRVLDEFRSSYVLHFAPRGVERAGVHTLEVAVKRPGVVVRARRTYAVR